MKFKAFFAVLAISAGISAIPAFAATPFYQISSVSGGANATYQISIANADANSAAVLYYYPQNSSGIASVGTIGVTNSAGALSLNIGSGTYSIPSGSNTYVVVNGQQSGSVQWPYFTGGTQSSVFLSQSQISMNVGQTSSVAMSGGIGSYYVSSNSNSASVNPTVNGSNLSVYALASGSSSVVVCSNGSFSGSNCATLFVTVNGTTNGGLILNQSALNMTVGQVSLVSSLNSSSANLYVSSNTSPNVASASASGNAVYVTANGIGYATITICSGTGYAACGTVNITVSQPYNQIASQNVTLAENSVTVYMGQSQSVAVYGSGNYYIASNSNQNVVSASVVGSGQVYVRGINPGSSMISICSNQYAAYGATCATLYVTVNSNYGYAAPVYAQPQQYYSAVAPAGAVYLSQVPYTGLADDMKLFAFVSMIVAFSGIAAYIIVGKKVFA